MKRFIRIAAVVLTLVLIFPLTAFSDNRKNSEEESLSFIKQFDAQIGSLLAEQYNKPDEIDLEFLLELYEIYSKEDGFIKIDVEFNEYYELFTYTPVFEGINDSLREPGMTYCQCYGTLMREIVMEDGSIIHEFITEEEFMYENSYCVLSEGNFFKISFSSDGLVHEQGISLDEYLDFHKDRMTEAEYNEFESAVLYTYSLIDGFVIFEDDDNSIMAICAPNKHKFPATWSPNRDFCHRACTLCSTPERLDHSHSEGSSISDTQHHVRCSRCKYVYLTVGHNWGNWFNNNNSATHRSNCVQGTYVPCSAFKTASHSFLPNKTCSICGYGLIIV